MTVSLVIFQMSPPDSAQNLAILAVMQLYGWSKFSILHVDSDYGNHDEVIKWKLFSALLATCEGNPPDTGEFPSQRPVTQSFHVFFDLRLNKRLSKQTRRWWFETPSRPYDVTVMIWTAIMVMDDMTTLWHENAFHYIAAGIVSTNVPGKLENIPWNTASIPKCLTRC